MQLGSSNNVWNSVLVSNLFAEHTGLRFSVDVTNGQSLTANGFAMEEISRSIKSLVVSQLGTIDLVMKVIIQG